jgi:hypothetical protein
MPVYYGNTELGSDFYGSLPQGKIYFGGDLVQNGTETFTATYLLLGGGGGGGYINGGGGGGGQFRNGSIVITPSTTFNITIGEGGAGGSGSAALNGSSSIFGSITAIGGGAGGNTGFSGSNGASGGGGGGNNGPGGTGSIGFNGGNGLYQDQFDPAGGGGGAGSAGVNAINFTAGNGGSGSFSSITGTSIEYSGGGGGGVQRQEATFGVGRGGGGNGGRTGVSPSLAVTGSPNTGGGGGGGGGLDANTIYSVGAKGGSGALILRYANSFSASLSSGLTYVIANDGSDKVLSVKSGSGNINFSVFVASNDPDAQAFINATGISGNDALAINILVEELKDAGIWDYLDAVYPMVGGTATTHKYNLIDPQDTDGAYRLNFQGGWTHDSSGALPNGTTAYADTHYVPSTNLTTANGHLSYFSFSNTATADMVEIGCINNNGSGGTDTDSFIRALYIDRAFFPWGGGDPNVGQTGSNGFYLLNATSSTTTDGWRNGTKIRSNGTTLNRGLPDVSVYVGAGNFRGLTAFAYSNRGCSFASIGETIPSGLEDDYYTIVSDYQSNLGR